MIHLGAPRSAYVHVPFCARRCGYCNFTVVADREDLVPAYLEALELELQRLGEPPEIDTLFLGGGTPTQLDAVSLSQLMKLLKRWFVLADNHEFSVEANPGELDEECASLLGGAGVNRISLGAQSFDEGKLIGLERNHNRDDIERSYRWARDTGAKVSLDLIFAAPREKLKTWRRDLQSALELAPNHVSTYGLTIERGTQFWNRQHRGVLTEVDEETQREMYELAIDTLTSAGFEHYEVSNFARPTDRCVHNQVYWQGGPYFGFGPGAASYVDGRRAVNHRSTSTYIKRMRSGVSPVESFEELGMEDRARERLVFALRMLEGIDEQEFERETGYSIESLVGPAVERFCEGALLRRDGGRLAMTRKGLLVSDSLWPELLV